jgi:hypothetical protein
MKLIPGRTNLHTGVLRLSVAPHRIRRVAASNHDRLPSVTHRYAEWLIVQVPPKYVGHRKEQAHDQRILSATVASVLLAFGAVTAVAAPANAAGGGCLPYTKGGWKISVCSSDNGVQVSADIYMDAVGSGSCSVAYRIWNITDGTIAGTSGDHIGFVESDNLDAVHLWKDEDPNFDHSRPGARPG